MSDMYDYDELHDLHETREERNQIMSNSKVITVKPANLDIMTLGRALAESGYFSDARDQAKAVVKILAGQELGIGPIASMTGIYIIQGKPTLSANTMAAVIAGHPKYNYKIIELTNEKVVIEFEANNKSLGLSQFTIEDANIAGLPSGNNKHSWRKYPRNMLFSRAISNGARWYCPDAFSGVSPYTPEELEISIDGETGEIVEIIEAPTIEDRARELEIPSMMAIKILEKEFDIEVTEEHLAEWRNE